MCCRFVLFAFAVLLLRAAIGADAAVVTVTVEPQSVTSTVKATPSLQVVSHNSLLSTSPIRNQVFKSLAELNEPRHARFAGWFPYPKLGVAELDPPSVGCTCTPMSWVGQQTASVHLSCGSAMNGVITAITFASYGTPFGYCGAYFADSVCHSNMSHAYVEGKCLGRRECSLHPEDITPDPCFGTQKYFAVQAQCTNATGVVTHWDFRTMDEVFLSFYEAVNGDASGPIVSFSTQPTWLYSPQNWEYPQNASTPYYGYDKGPAWMCNNTTLLGEYYGRVLSWYMKGGFVDEAGEWHDSGHHLNVSWVEVFNEVDYEHEYDVELYTKAYDAVVLGIRSALGPELSGRLKFNGLCLPNIDNATKVESWVTYFLNVSNHDPRCRDAIHSIGYHAYPTNGPYTSDPASFEQMFGYVDTFRAEVQAIDAIIRRSDVPDTVTMLDECGTDMDQVLSSPSVPPPHDNIYYWVASGGYYAYLFGSIVGRLPNSTVRVVGESQLMDSYPQEPSVTMLDWSSGLGTARYWALSLLLETVSVGDAALATATTCDQQLFAQGFRSAASPSTVSLLLVNKKFHPVLMNISVAGTNGGLCTGRRIDNSTLLGPAVDFPCTVGGAPLELPAFATAVVVFSKASDRARLQK